MTLFELLCDRLPLWSDDEASFWELKRAGRIAPATPEERARIPACLLAVAERALAANADERQADGLAFATELREAHRALLRGPVQTSSATWSRMLNVLLIASLALGATLVWLREPQKPVTRASQEQGHWELLLDRSLERGSGEGLRDLKVSPGGVELLSLSDTSLVLDGAVAADAEVMLDHPLPSQVRIAWTAQAVQGPEALACFIGGPTRAQAYALGVENQRCVLRRAGQVLAEVALSQPLEGKRPYRFALERHGARLQLQINGQQILAVEDDLPLIGPGGDRFGFAVGRSTLQIDHLRIESWSDGRHLSMQAHAEQLAACGQLVAAADAYAVLARRLGENGEGAQAALGAVQCRLANGDAMGARDAVQVLLARADTAAKRLPLQLTMLAIAVALGDEQAVAESCRALAIDDAVGHLRRRAVLVIEAWLQEQGPVATVADAEACQQQLAQLRHWTALLGLSLADSALAQAYEARLGSLSATAAP